MSVLVQIATASASPASAASTLDRGHAELGADRLRGRPVDVRDARQLHARDAPRQQLRVHAPDAPDADHRDPHAQSSRSDTTSSQRPDSAERSRAAWTDTHASAASKPGENGRRSAIAAQNAASSIVTRSS